MKVKNLVKTLMCLGLLNSPVYAEPVNELEGFLKNVEIHEIKDDGSVVIASSDLSKLMENTRRIQLNARLVEFRDDLAVIKFYKLAKEADLLWGHDAEDTSIFGSYTCTVANLEDEEVFGAYTCTTVDIDD